MKHLARLHNVPRNSATSWQTRHRAAITSPTGFEKAIVYSFKGWLIYADNHYDRYHSGIGEDGVLGPAWQEIGQALRTLLNGETGRLDCGTLDGVICDSLTAEGYGEG